jgi:predicted nucleotide-binding protein
MASNNPRVVERLRALISEAPNVDPKGVRPWRERARLAVIAAYGEQSSHLERFDKISYSLGIWTDSTPRSAFDRAALGGVRTAVAMLEAFVEDLDDGAPAPISSTSDGRRVFVVHGRNDGIREEVARFLERLGFEAVILHEQTDQGRTIIEKFEAHALDVSYAVVLLSPDDYGRGPDDDNWPEAPNRARQNVILELGYFMGKLGRASTAALFLHGTELPSDIHGMLYIPFDDTWRLRLAKEMRDSGLDVDLNLL